MVNTLNEFYKASGLKVNFDKSRGMCFPSVTVRRKNNFTAISAIHFASDLGCYLGFPLVFGRVKRTVFDPLLEKIQSRLASSKGRLLNKAEKLCLASSVLSTIPSYTT